MLTPIQKIYDIYVENYASDEVECVIQREIMTEEDREAFLNRFHVKEDAEMDVDFKDVLQFDVEIEEERTLVGFCVLGGIFSEGIDLKNDSLIGAIIVGTGFPQVCFERELLKEYFDDREGNGFDYAYRYPGMNKVLQAAGRVIRTAEDIGTIVLLDERFLQISYRKLFPREWDHYEVVNKDTLERKMERFWDSWGKYES